MKLDFNKFDTICHTSNLEAENEQINDIDEQYAIKEENAFKPLLNVSEDYPEELATIISINDMEKIKALKQEIEDSICKPVEKEDILLLAVELVGLVMNDTTYYERVREKIIEVWGEGRLDTIPLEWKIKDLKREVEKMNHSLKRKSLSYQAKTDIKESITIYEEQIGILENLLKDNAQLKLNL